MAVSSPRSPKSGANRASSGFRASAIASPATPSLLFVVLSVVVLAAAVIAVYWNSLFGAMLLDDRSWILDNSSIKNLSLIGDVLFPSGMEVHGGRPLVNLSLALNYQFGGTNPIGYHLVNIGIHLFATLILFGIVRRTLLLPRLADRFGAAATPLALAVALVWAVHPLQTAAVTYIIQRSESLMGLFYLSTLYCVIRGASVGLGNAVKRRLWYTGAVTACALGMMTKEVMFTAPLVIFVYDSLFLANSSRAALSERRWLYACLATAWSVGALMLWLTSIHANTTGFGVREFAWQSYALSQPRAILHYLQSSFWPAGLCLDYGWPTVNLWQAVIPGIIVATLLAATVFGLAKRSPLGFLGACFFLILAPTSSVIPNFDLAIDHRMYLPLAALTTLMVIAVYAFWKLIAANNKEPALVSRVRHWFIPLALLVAVVSGLGWATFERNKTFESGETIWRDVIAKRPENWRAYASLAYASDRSGNKSKAIELYRQALERNPQEPQVHLYLGSLLASRDDADEAIEHFRQAVKFAPRYALANDALGHALVKKGQNEEAMVFLRDAVRFDPGLASARDGLARLLIQQGQFGEAIQQAEAILADQPNFAPAHDDLARGLLAKGQYSEAIVHARKALAADPSLSDSAYTLAVALSRTGKYNEAIGYMEKDLADRPKDVAANFNLAMLYDKSGQPDKAAAQYERVLELDRNHRGARLNLGAVREQQGRFEDAIAEYTALLGDETHDPAIEVRIANLYARQGDLRHAVAHFETAVAADPRNADAHLQLAACYVHAHQDDDAAQHYRSAIEIRPNSVASHNDLAVVLARQGKLDEAEKEFSEAIKLDPNHASAHANLGMVFLREEKKPEAVEQWRIAAKLTPKDVTLIRNLAWTLATSSDAKVRSGLEAVQWAKRAVELTDSSDPNALGILAGAYAEAGQFPNAVKSGERALELANLRGQQDLADQLTERLKLYRSGSPYHGPPSP